MITSADIHVGADAFLEGRGQVLEGVEVVGEHEDRFASDVVPEVWKDIASIEAGPVGNGRGRRVMDIIRYAGYLDYVDNRRSFGIVLPSRRVFVTPAIPLEYVDAVISQWHYDAVHAGVALRLRREGVDNGYEDVVVPDLEGMVYQRARAARRLHGMRVDHLSINSRGEIELGMRMSTPIELARAQGFEIVELAGDIIETGR